MHGPGEEHGFDGAVGGTPSNGGNAEESWFRFGDEPGAPAAGGERQQPDRRPAAPEPTAAAASRDADEPRHQPFVVSATPGGVDPKFMQAAESVTFSVGRSGGLTGLVTAVAVAAAVGLGGLAFWKGPAIAAAFSQSDASVWHEDLNSAMAEAIATDRPMLVHFTADWCPPCRMMKKNVFSDDSVQTLIERDFVLVRIDLTDRMGPNTLIAQECGVTSIPAIHVFSSEGWAVGSMGFVGSPVEFIAELNRLRGG